VKTFKFNLTQPHRVNPHAVAMAEGGRNAEGGTSRKERLQETVCVE
jgi:hypothetical protein